MNTMKTIDRLLLKGFLPPFVVTFFIALFVLVMQTLWMYIDDIAGKGVGFFLLTELVGYMSVSMIPMALPLAVLISSVMVMGNMAERYELSSMKSAGVSLWRVMWPLMWVTALVGGVSFLCSNHLIPVSNLKFKSRLHDIKYQKPALSLEESVFNNDFQGFSIRIGDKRSDGRTIHDVQVFDNREANQGRLTLVTADSGQMYGTPDGNFFIMDLYDGYQYLEPKPTQTKNGRNYPMMRASFRAWTKVFDLYEFELDRTDENLFKSHHTMLSNRQLLIAIDSIDRDIAGKILRLAEVTNRNYYFWDKAWEEEQAARREKEAADIRAAKQEAARAAAVASGGADTLSDAVVPLTVTRSAPGTLPDRSSSVPPGGPARGRKIEAPRDQIDPWPQDIRGELSAYPSFVSLFIPSKQDLLMEKAAGIVRTLKDQAVNTEQSLRRTRESRVKHIFEYHMKFNLAVACIVFLFIGAPMGAIVRKGGFGWPMLISIVFFMLFIIINIFSKNIAERSVIYPVPASWMSTLVVFPLGWLLTYWAMRDMGWSHIREAFRLLPRRSRKPRTESPAKD